MLLPKGASGVYPACSSFISWQLLVRSPLHTITSLSVSRTSFALTSLSSVSQDLEQASLETVMNVLEDVHWGRSYCKPIKKKENSRKCFHRSIFILPYIAYRRILNSANINFKHLANAWDSCIDLCCFAAGSLCDLWNSLLLVKSRLKVLYISKAFFGE